MDFKNRKENIKPFFDYLKNENCTMEQLLGLRASIQALEVGVEKALRRVHRSKTRLEDRVNLKNEMDWLD